MEHVYALGVSCIEFVQEWFSGAECYFELINDFTNPNAALEVLFPLVAIVDSVFAAQLTLCMAFGSWLNAILKWWLLEDRPYWWVQETDFYAANQRPVIRQFRQTCETGPGCPSGHSENTAMLLVLFICWISHVQNDRKVVFWWWKYLFYPLGTFLMLSVMAARVYVGTHFPHQCLLGALLGAFLAPALCIYVSDPFIWRCGAQGRMPVNTAMSWHVAAALVTAALGLLTFLSLVMFGFDPLWTVKLAFRWCQNPDSIHVSTTPMYALVNSTGHLLGWAMCVTPAIAQYRHYTKNRSLIIATSVTGLLVYTWSLLQQNISKDKAWQFYLFQFILCVVKPALLLRVTPALAMWPFSRKEKVA